VLLSKKCQLLLHNGGLQSKNSGVIWGWGITLLCLFLNAFDFSDLSAECEACEVKLMAKVVILFKIQNCLVKVVPGNEFELMK